MLTIGISTVLVGLPLIVLARLAIAMPDAGWPARGHTGEVDGQGRCVECGWALREGEAGR